MRANETFLSFHRNPVTGSVARYSGSGASADIEESEPLGQTVETSDPGTGYPTSYEDVRGIARDPEWQCLAAGLKRSTFNEMPVHCKKAKLAERDFYLPGALAESDPKRVAMPPDGHGSPGRGTPSTLKTGQSLAPEHLAQMRALTATGKFDNEEDGPDCGLTNCVVNIESDSDPLASIDASVSQVRDACDISDLVVPPIANIKDNVMIAEVSFAKAQAAYAAALGSTARAANSGNPVETLFTAAAGALNAGNALKNHALWFYSVVKAGGDWDYKSKTTQTVGTKSIWEPFGNFHYGVVGAAAGFDRGKTLQRMAGLIQEQSGQPGGGGEHGGYASIIADWITGSDGGPNYNDPRLTPRAPYKDEWDDQRLIKRGIAYYRAGCHKR